MKSVSAGASAKYTISDKQLKKAPSDPGERYVWGTKLCLEKVAGCTSDDVEEIYDPLIEQSCKAAGISSEMQNLAKEINEEKTEGSCSTEIRSCVVDTKRCRADYRSCESDEVFDKHFSECGVLSTGCESFLAGIKNKLNSARLSAFENADQLLKTIVESYQKLREQKLASAQNSCKNNSAKDACMERVCKSNMRNKCAVGFEYEKTVADQLCKFYETACDRLK